jgi:hypothetical protein
MDVILETLRPQSLADVFIYAIFFTVLGVLGAMPEKNETPMYILFGLILLCILDLMRTRVERFPIPGSDDKGFFTFIIHIAMAMFPFIVAGMIRRRGKKGAAAVPLAILGGLLGSLYAAMSFIAPEALYGAL